MPIYKDNAQNRRLKRVGKSWGKECQPCETKKKTSAPKSKPATKKEKEYIIPLDTYRKLIYQTQI